MRWLDNLLYRYTKPFDVVVDPVAGGGSTIEICKKRLRRYWVCDRKPTVEREKEIRRHDLTDGLLRLPMKDVSLVYLDPPYWIQAKGQYSDDPTDLGNMTLEAFNATLAGVINGFAAKMKASAREAPSYIALIIQPTQWKAPERKFVGQWRHAARRQARQSICRFRSLTKASNATRKWLSVPYETLQFSRPEAAEKLLCGRVG